MYCDHLKTSIDLYLYLTENGQCKICRHYSRQAYSGENFPKKRLKEKLKRQKSYVSRKKKMLMERILSKK
jgi:hypothetical protein